MTKEFFILVDVGCIECGEQTEVVGIFTDEKEIDTAVEDYCKFRKIDKWEPRGGFLELLGLYKKGATSYLGGVGYFRGGQHALEIHVWPPREIINTDDLPEAEREIEK